MSCNDPAPEVIGEEVAPIVEDVNPSLTVGPIQEETKETPQETNVGAAVGITLSMIVVTIAIIIAFAIGVTAVIVLCCGGGSVAAGSTLIKKLTMNKGQKIPLSVNITAGDATDRKHLKIESNSEVRLNQTPDQEIIIAEQAPAPEPEPEGVEVNEEEAQYPVEAADLE